MKKYVTSHHTEINIFSFCEDFNSSSDFSEVYMAERHQDWLQKL